MNKKEKLESVRIILKELEASIADHLEDEENSELHAIDLIDSALEIYKEFSEEG